MKIKKFSTEKDFVQAGVDILSEICQKKTKKITVALSGGNTPQSLYSAIAKAPLPFDRIEFFQVDERYVSHDHEDSNYKMIRSALPNQKIHFFNTGLSIKDALKKYTTELPLTPFDLTILGIGPDGHIASLFPHTEALTEKNPVTHTTTHQFTVTDRLTLTFPPILQSKKLLILLKGASKEPIVDALRTDKKEFTDFPAQKLIKHPNLHVFFYRT